MDILKKLESLKSRRAPQAIDARPLQIRLAARLVNSPTDTGSTAPSESSPRATERLQKLSSKAQPSAGSAEILRICAMPIAPRMRLGTPEFEEFNREHLLSHAFESGFRFFEPQANAIRDFERYGGFLAPIGVGWGKTLITLACAGIAATRYEISRVLLVVPSSVYSQLVDQMIPAARNKIPFPLQVIGLGGRSQDQRKFLARSKRRGLYLLPYSYLSTKDAPELLEEISADCVLLDEAHNLKSRRAARTRRMLDWIAERKPKLVGSLSGTLTSKSLMDYHHLARVCLGERSPMPLSNQMAGEWSMVVDAGAPPTSVLHGNPIEPLVRWACHHFPDLAKEQVDVSGFRRAYQLRFLTTPGVIATGDQEIGVSLVLQNRPVPAYEKAHDYERLKKLIQDVDTLWVTPNGDEIDYAIHLFKWLYELHSGCYNELTWPTPADLAQRRGIAETAAEDLLARAKAHHSLHQIYSKELRTYLLNGPSPGVDTPMLVAAELERHPRSPRLPAKLRDKWAEMRAADFTGRPERDSRAIRVCDYKIMEAMRRVRLWDGGGIVWVHHIEIGQWAYEMFRADGIDALHCPAGDEANRAICDPANKDKIVIASMSAHGTGKNLQHFQRQLFLQWPRSAVTAEQTIGRTHRNGQEADELVVEMMLTTKFDELLFAACLNDAVYIQQTTGTRNKIVYCSYDPLPKVYSHAFLRARGFDPKAIDSKGTNLLKEKFGDILAS